MGPIKPTFPRDPGSDKAPSSPGGAEVTYKIPDEEAPDLSAPAQVAFQFSSDRSQAFISIRSPWTGELDADFILYRWMQAGLQAGLLERKQAEALAREWNRLHQPIEGRLVVDSPYPPMPGENARIEYLVDLSQQAGPESRDGVIDFRNLNLIKPVKQDQPLARKLPAGKGSPGADVFGAEIPGADGVDVPLPAGINVVASPSDPNLLVAKVSGFLQVKGGLLNVNECFIVNGSVDYSTGNINYDQSAVIKGDIQDGFTVSVGGDLEVGGAVGEAKVMVGGNVLIKKGFVGSGHGMVTAKGNVALGFSSNQNIRAHGNVIVDKESFNCNILSRQGITVFGPLVGGASMAFVELICRTAGNDLGTRTELEAGQDYILHENKILLEEKLKELTFNLGKIGQKLARFREGYRLRKRFTSSEARMLLELRDMQEKIQARLPELERRKLDLIEQIRMGYLREGIRVRVEKKVNPGVVIKVGTECLRIQEELSGPRIFLYQQGRIKIF